MLVPNATDLLVMVTVPEPVIIVLSVANVTVSPETVASIPEPPTNFNVSPNAIVEVVDVVSAIVKLKASINELNQKGRERLLEAFTKVNRKFNEVYTKLFNGGSAKIELVDSDDPLEAGLEMFVSPPGKRLQSITLLSGGEQALTALSLVFAVFLVNPSPICVLDEVDAPLDDANVTRFCGLLDDLTKITNTKFIIITHHALTMSRMDRLYGVTMAEQGVSQLVSVDLQRAEELVA